MNQRGTCFNVIAVALAYQAATCYTNSYHASTGTFLHMGGPLSSDGINVTRKR
jgi:hypothetical protein